MKYTVHIDTSEFDATNEEVKRRLSDVRPPLRKFHVYMIGETGKTFRKLARGGTYRGVTWKPFAPQYTRVTDGVTVPAWGGVPKVRGTGLVKGRLRPSGQRVTPSSNLLRDTGRLAAQAGLTARWSRGGRVLDMVTEGVDYAARQQEMRPFLFMTTRDVRVVQRLVREHIEGE